MIFKQSPKREQKKWKICKMNEAREILYEVFIWRPFIPNQIHIIPPIRDPSSLLHKTTIQELTVSIAFIPISYSCSTVSHAHFEISILLAYVHYMLVQGRQMVDGEVQNMKDEVTVSGSSRRSGTWSGRRMKGRSWWLF